jgi:hypothetical protein
VPPEVRYERTCALYVPAVVAVVLDVPVPVTLPVQSKPVASLGVVAENVTAVPAHFGPSCVGAGGTVGVVTTVPVTANRVADTQPVVKCRASA